MGLDCAYPAKRWVFSGPTSYAMESSAWYWKKIGETLWDLETNCGKGMQECKQNLTWFETTGPVMSSVESWRCWCLMSRSGSRKLRRRIIGMTFLHRACQMQFRLSPSKASSKSLCWCDQCLLNQPSACSESTAEIKECLIRSNITFAIFCS